MALVLVGCIQILHIHVQPVVFVDALDVIDALLVLAPRLNLVLHSHFAQSVPSALYFSSAVTLFDKPFHQVPLVRRLPSLQLPYVLLLVKNSEQVVFLPDRHKFLFDGLLLMNPLLGLLVLLLVAL